MKAKLYVIYRAPLTRGVSGVIGVDGIARNPASAAGEALMALALELERVHRGQPMDGDLK